MTTDRADGARAPLRVETDLDVSVDGTPVEVASTGDRLFVEVPTVVAGVRLARTGLAGVDDRLDALLETTALTVEVRVRGTTVAVLGADARPGALSRRLGVAPVEARVGGAAVAAGRGLLAVARAVDRRLG
ncbi:hypothetical protein [Candidatus Halobonum tyrrellensis]|uniref:Peptide ABC transporter ATP-binding protein n=1 Tax=Candidatus Halobonum tyrrellensis G22 TaxID=1324957 RepID=V4GS93_9EURY|nr:hypothetical protein [Candidatus Halobonum tyrrellensis]ESP87951.1 hypothetical protein K933_11561 [Candidatus Halobonum tyrrellensis G22]